MHLSGIDLSDGVRWPFQSPGSLSYAYSHPNSPHSASVMSENSILLKTQVDRTVSLEF